MDHDTECLSRAILADDGLNVGRYSISKIFGRMCFSAHVERETAVARDGKARLAMMGSRFWHIFPPDKRRLQQRPVVSVSYIQRTIRAFDPSLW